MRTGLIYKITCTENGYFLYGSTINFKNRTAKYVSSLKRNNYKNTILQNCYNKHGKNSLKFEIVQKDIPESILESIENIWIGANCSKSDDKKGGMNMQDADMFNKSEDLKNKISNNTKKSMNKPEIKAKLSQRNKGKKHYNWGKKSSDVHSSKKVLEYDKYGNFVTEWSSRKDAADYYNFSKSFVTISIKENRLCKGKHWFKDKIENYPIKITPDYIDKFTQGKIGSIYVYDSKGVLIGIYETSREASLGTGASQDKVNAVIRGSQKTAKGYIFKRFKNNS